MEIIQNDNCKLAIDLNGGRIAQLILDGQLVLGTFERIDGKKGNTHICCPNFGNEGMEKFGIPFHGPFRNLEWNLINKRQNEIVIETKNLALKIKQTFKLINGFEQIIEVQNLSDRKRIINLAVHNYWDVGCSWEGIKLNGKIIDDLIKSDSSGVLLTENVLEIPNKFKYQWKLDGFKKGRFWTAFKEINDKKEYDQNYICVEPSLEEQGFLDNGLENLLSLGYIKVKQTIHLVKS